MSVLNFNTQSNQFDAKTIALNGLTVNLGDLGFTLNKRTDAMLARVGQVASFNPQDFQSNNKVAWEWARETVADFQDALTTFSANLKTLELKGSLKGRQQTLLREFLGDVFSRVDKVMSNELTSSMPLAFDQQGHATLSVGEKLSNLKAECNEYLSHKPANPFAGISQLKELPKLQLTEDAEVKADAPKPKKLKI